MNAAIVRMAAAAGLTLGASALAAQGGTSITIYSSAAPGAVPADMYRPVPGNPYAQYQRGPVPGYATVRQDVKFDLAKGVSTVKFTDVAALIDPTTVSFKALGDAGASVLEQNYQFDLVSNEKLMERFLGKTISVTVPRGQQTEVLTGMLLSTSPNGMVLQSPGGKVEIVNGYSGVTLPELPGGLMTKPTLVWNINADKGGRQDVRVAYQTDGITWWADYNLTFAESKDANSGTLDVGAWVSILNQSGATYSDATLKLIAGDVQRAPQQQNQYMALESRAAGSVSGVAGFAEKSFFEYHLYTLGRPATLPDNSTKQLELFPAATKVPCEKIVVYDGLSAMGVWAYPDPMLDQNFGLQSKKDVDVYLRFVNSKEKGMGMPLPAGRIRVSKLDTDGSLEFIGEDVIRHTPRDEEVLVKMGRAFDVVGERRQVDYRVDTGRKEMVETIEIKVRNHKEETVKVIVQEHMYRWLNWEFVGPTAEFKKLDARTVHFPLTLEKGREGVVKYTVRYSW